MLKRSGGGSPRASSSDLTIVESRRGQRFRAGVESQIKEETGVKTDFRDVWLSTEFCETSALRFDAVSTLNTFYRFTHLASVPRLLQLFHLVFLHFLENKIKATFKTESAIFLFREFFPFQIKFSPSRDSSTRQISLKPSKSSGI